MLCNKCNLEFENNEEIKIVFNEKDDNKQYVCERCFSRIQESRNKKYKKSSLKEDLDEDEEENSEIDLDEQIENELRSSKIEEKSDPDQKWKGHSGKGTPVKIRKGWS